MAVNTVTDSANEGLRTIASMIVFWTVSYTHLPFTDI